MLSVVTGIKEYVQSMVDGISGMKVLILDQETTGIISMVFSQSDILEHEVFLVDRIDSGTQDKMRHLNAICFLRPTNQNFVLLSKELRAPKYAEYHLFWANAVPHHRLEQLACCDEYEVVRQVQEYFADIFAVNHDLFALNIPSTMRLYQPQSSWSSYEETVFERMVEGLLSACLGLRMLPAIRYPRSSELCHIVARRLQERISEEQGLFEALDRERKKDEPLPVLLVLDRRNDPVTPLLNQWTYQAMLHENLTIENNRINMEKAPGTKPEMREIVMSTSADQFFEENALANFGDLGMSIKVYVEQYQQQTKNTAKIESIEEMQRFVDEYPEFRKLSGNVSKHVAVVHELSRLVEVGNLLEVSQLEQDIACAENRKAHFNQVTELLRSDRIRNFDRLRLVLLYALRYEHDSSLQQIREELKRANGGLDDTEARLPDQLLEYAGSHVRSGDLFQNKTLLAQAKSSLSKGFKGVENVYTQHKTPLASTLTSLLGGSLKEANYPFAEGCRYAASRSDHPHRVIVFVVGGTTYEEARDVAEINRGLEAGRSVVLGGSTIHNSRSFLADVAQLQRGVGTYSGGTGLE